jgi:hypothetical protein
MDWVKALLECSLDHTWLVLEGDELQLWQASRLVLEPLFLGRRPLKF